jgi:hypothetical protein
VFLRTDALAYFVLVGGGKEKSVVPSAVGTSFPATTLKSSKYIFILSVGLSTNVIKTFFPFVTDATDTIS